VQEALRPTSQLTPERFLNFDPMDRWEPLGKSLRKSIYDYPFTRVNDSEAMQERGLVSSFKKAMMVAGALGVALAGKYWYGEWIRCAWNKNTGPAHNSRKD
jgi:hypothetical protein